MPRLAQVVLPLIVGHGNGESQNLRWQGSRPWAVHDWDSLVALPEEAIDGAASGAFASTPSQRWQPSKARKNSSSHTSRRGVGRLPRKSERLPARRACGLRCITSAVKVSPSPRLPRWTRLLGRHRNDFIALAFSKVFSYGKSWESGRLEDNRIGMALPQPTAGLVVHGKLAELRELKVRICRAVLLAASRTGSWLEDGPQHRACGERRTNFWQPLAKARLAWKICGITRILCQPVEKCDDKRNPNRTRIGQKRNQLFVQ